MKKRLLYFLLSLLMIIISAAFSTKKAAASYGTETQEYTFANMTYEIPVEWKEIGNNTEINHYYYTETSMIMVNNGSTTTGRTVLTESDQELYLKTLETQFDKFELIENKSYTVGPYTGFCFRANVKIDSNETLMYAIVFDNAKQMRAFTINCFNDTDDTAVLDEIAASVKFNDTDETSTEQKTTESKKTSGSTDEQTAFNKDTSVEKAKWYIKYSAFSQKGLVKQLVFDGFSEDDAEYGAANCEADWSEECAEKAQRYLDYKSFSRDELHDQLEYEGYTESQILYGLAKVGL